MIDINTYDGLVNCLELQKQNLPAYTAQVGATPGDLTEITNELTNLVLIRDYVQVVDAYKKTFVGIKQALYNGDPTRGIPPYPSGMPMPVLSTPLAGALKRTRERNRRFKAAPGYTIEIGEALGIEGEVAIPIPQPPIIDVFTSKMGFGLTVVVTGRGESDAWECLVQVVGGPNTWTSIGFSTTKSKDFVYNPGPTASDNPVQLRIMVQLKKNNANFAGPSEIALATVNP